MAQNNADASENELLTQAAQGSKEAFGELYEKYLEQIYRFIFYRVADHNEAEDLTELVFIKTWQTLPKLSVQGKTISNFRAWLYRIAHNLVIDHHRSHRKSVSLDQIVSQTDPKPGPEEVTESHEQSHQLATAISKLEPRLQQVLICRFINQLDYTETAHIMGIKPGYVRVLQYRALKKIGGILEEEIINHVQ